MGSVCLVQGDTSSMIKFASHIPLDVLLILEKIVFNAKRPMN